LRGKIRHITQIGKTKDAEEISVGKPVGKWHCGRQECDGRITLRWTLGKYCVEMGGRWN
jgi:hypothetical protein